MLFAAGLGTRMRPLTDTLPKPLVQVAGRPLLDHALDLVHGAGLTRIVANTHYLAEQMEAALAARAVKAVHEPVLLDTGGGLRNALPHLKRGPVLTLNTDCVWTGPNPIECLCNVWDRDRMDAMLLLIEHDNAVGHRGSGDFFLSDDGRLSRGKGMVYSGLQVVNPDCVRDVQKRVFSLNELWDLLAARGRLFGLIHKGGWVDVGRPSSIALAEELLEFPNVRD